MFKDLSPIERYSVLDDTWASLLSNNTTVSNFYEFLLNAQILLANSERNYLLAQYSLLKSIGLLNNNYLKIQ